MADSIDHTGHSVQQMLCQSGVLRGAGLQQSFLMLCKKAKKVPIWSQGMGLSQEQSASEEWL